MSVFSSKPLNILFALSLMLGMTAGLHAEEDSRKPNVLVFTQNRTNDKDIPRRINSILSSRLKDQELNAIEIEDDIRTEELLENAAWMGAFFVIEADYDLKPKSLYMELNCYSAWDKQLLCSVHNEHLISTKPEQITDRAMDKIIPVIISALESVKSAPPPGWDWWKEDEDVPVEEEQELPPDTAEPESPEMEVPPSPETGKPNNREGLPSTEKETDQGDSELQKSRILISLAGAPLIATAESSEYFDYGFHMSLFGGYRLLTAPVDLIAGGRFGWDSFKAEGVLADSDNNICYFGPELQAGLSVRRGGRVYVRMSGGLSYLFMDTEYTGPEYTTLPYFSIGLGTEIMLNQRFGLLYSGDYTLHFEETTVFSGFYPSIALSLYL